MKLSKQFVLRVTLSSAIALSFSQTSFGQSSEPPSLEDLMKVEVTSVSKKPQKLANVAAAVHVITAEDIKLSGSTSIAEALQLAPGMSVIRLNSSRWGVNARGYGDRLANKLLVLVDGRNAFNPAVSGVFWETFQFPLEDIARIEVIRGPAASAWGPNGVNGVINIVTKSASSTQGGQVVAGGGNFEGPYARLRYGGASEANDFFYRGYGVWNKPRDYKSLNGGPGNDEAETKSAGFRMDGYLTGGARWDLSGDFVDRNAAGGQDYKLPDYMPPPGEKTESHSIRGRYQTTLANGSDVQVQSAIAATRIQVGAVFDDRITFDLDAQQRIRLANRNDVVWGVNYRFSSDENSVSPILRLNEPKRKISYLGVFGQDEVEVTDTLKLTLAMRVDDSPLARMQTQPSARVTWNAAPTQTVWGSVSRAARAPSRGEIGLNLNLIGGQAPSPTGFPALPQTVPVVLSFSPSDKLASERLDALELGWRAQWSAALSTDLTLFYHRFDRLRNTAPTGLPFPIFAPAPPVIAAIVTPFEFNRTGTMNIGGAELSMDWRIDPTLRLQLATWVNEVSNFNVDDGALIPPKVVASLRASWAPTSQWNLDLWLRYMSGRQDSTLLPVYIRRPVTTVDARIGWRFSKAWEIAITGKNLTDSACDVYSTNAPIAIEASRIVPTCSGRAVSAEIRGDF
jgi:iron complex outermembrane recepter protein